MATPSRSARRTGHRILVVEDEPAVAEVVERYLRRDGHEVDVAREGLRALRSVQDQPPSLMVLDLGLPDLDGIEVCRRIREHSELPIIMLSARVDEVAKLRGLEAGADDYVTKPFSARELAARVTAVLRRANAAAHAGGEIRAGSLRIDPIGRVAFCAERPIALTVREFDLLYHLAAHPGRAFTRGELLDAIWGAGFAGSEGTITVHVRRIREKLEEQPSRPRHLCTVWGVGYKFEP